MAGYGEGGLLALYSAALDTRIDATLVSGYFDARQDMWSEPVSRNGWVSHDADSLIPRSLIIEAAKGPEFELPGKGGPPASLDTPDPKVVSSEVARAKNS